MLNFTQKRKSVSRLLAPVALAVILAGCGSTPQQSASIADITSAAQQSSASYLVKAESSAGAESINWHILALKALIKEGSWPQAEKQAMRLSRMSLSPVQLAEWQLAKATLSYQQAQPQQALETLNFQPWWQLSPNQYRRYHLLRAELFTQTKQTFKAAQARTALDQYLAPTAKAENWQALWTDLSHYSNNQLQSVTFSDDDSVLRGWVQLAILKNTYLARPSQLKGAVEEWLAANPYHPAHQYLPSDLQAIMDLEIAQLDKVALLLPMSGRFEAQGKAVRDGFINAMLDDGNRDGSTELSIFDTESEAMNNILGKLNQDGVQFVIGPLRKNKVTEFQQLNSGKITQLALNEPAQLDLRQANTCYFSLSPEQEAEQAAQHLFAKGHQFPMVLAPNNKFGQRVSAAFAEQWQQLTGKAPQLETFGSRKQIQQQIAAIFGLTESQNRISQMQKVVGRSLESQQRSRRDTDAVYLIANKAELTLLKPFIDVAINPDQKPPKLYASSRGNPEKSGDTSELRGIEFSDIPLLVEPNQNFMARFDNLWPNKNNTAVRLHAFGMDAYKMINELPQMQVVEHYSTPGKTGILSTDENCVVQRQISWAVFTNNGIQAAQ